MARRNGAPAVAGKTRDDPGDAALTAAARPVDLDGSERSGYRRKAKRETWQEEAWSFFDIIGEVKQPTYFLANTCGLVRIFIGYQPDPEQDPVMAPDGMAGVFEAKDILDRLNQGSRAGVAGLMRESVINHKVAGECWLVGFPEQIETPPNPMTGDEGASYEPETWDVMSVSEVFTKGTGKGMRYWYRTDPNNRTGTEFPTTEDGAPKTWLIRSWLEHPEFSELPDCALRALLPLCEELLILTRVVKATGRSRLAGAGVLFLSNTFEIVSPPVSQSEPAGETKPEKSFAERLMEAMTAPIQNEGDASAIVPLVVRGPTDAVEKGVKHVTFDRPLDAQMLEQRREIIQRLAQGTDVPMEIVVGLKNINHWTSYQVDQSVWSRYGHPAVRAVVDSWTTGLLRPMLEEVYGLSPEVASRLMVWFDPAEAVTQPDRSANVIAAFDRFGISWEALRTYLQLSDADAPEDDEIARRIEIAVAVKGSAGSGADSSDPSGGGAPNGGTPPASPDAVTRQVEALLPELAEYLRANEGRMPVVMPHTSRAAITAAARPARRGSQPLGGALSGIDRRLRDSLGQLADAAMMRALDQAGARLRNRAKRTPSIATAVRDLPAHQVPARLGQTTARALGFATDDELLAGSFDAMEPRFHQKVSAAQQQTLDLLAQDYDLDEDELRSLSVQQERDRNDAWVWLAAALVALGHDRLYQPQPEAPERGEFDASATVPPGILREALARAGGAPGGTVTSDNRPVGGVATGQLVADVWARHGQVVSGWRWVYGDPGSRTTPFDPHLDLDGTEFATWDDDALANPSDWPAVDFLRPGDHPWCQCDFEAVGPGPLGAGDEEGAEDETDAVPVEA